MNMEQLSLSASTLKILMSISFWKGDKLDHFQLGRLSPVVRVLEDRMCVSDDISKLSSEINSRELSARADLRDVVELLLLLVCSNIK